MNEVWLPIKGFEGLYEISSLGRVKSLPNLKRGRKGASPYMTKERIRSCGLKSRYHVVDLYRRDGSYLFITVHRLVATHFIDNPLNHPYINHIDEDCRNNRVDNLEWVSNRENVSRRIVNTPIRYRGSKPSKYIGVSWKKQHKAWIANISVNNRQVYLGQFKSEIEAANAYQEALVKYKITNKYAII